MKKKKIRTSLISQIHRCSLYIQRNLSILKTLKLFRCLLTIIPILYIVVIIIIALVLSQYYIFLGLILIVCIHEYTKFF